MQQPIKRKKVIKFLNRVCKHLPERTYQALHRFGKPMYQDAEGLLWPNNDEEGSRRMVWRYVETHKHNAKRLCLHIYDRWGMQAVAYYFQVNGLQVNMDGSVSNLQPNTATLGPQEGNHLTEENLS